MIDLMPCPFCGSNNITDGGGNVFGTYWRCTDCGIHGPAKDGLPAATLAWNTQAGYAAGVRAGLEQAAKWHDEQADKNKSDSETNAIHGSGSFALHYQIQEQEHREYAAAIRATPPAAQP